MDRVWKPNVGTGSSVHNVRSVEKAFAVLEAFRNGERFLGLREIVEATGLDKSSVQRFTRTLRSIGYLEQDPNTYRYALSKRVLDLSFAYLSSNALIDHAAPILINLRRTTAERVDMTLLDGDSLVFVYRLQSKRESFPAALVGRRVPLFCTAGGRAVLAGLPDAEARTIVERSERIAKTPKTLIRTADIMEQVKKARERGYALQAEEWRLSEMVLAAALVDRDNRPIGAIHVAGLTSEWTAEAFEERMGSLVAAAAQDISA